MLETASYKDNYTESSGRFRERQRAVEQKNDFRIQSSTSFSGFYVVLTAFVSHSWKQNTLRAHTDRQAFSPVCTAIDNLPQSFPSPWAEQRHCLSFPLSSFHLCFQKTKRTLHYALKQCNLLLPWSIRAQPQAVSRLQAISLCDYCFV